MSWGLAEMAEDVRAKLQYMDRYTTALIHSKINEGLDDIKVFNGTDLDVWECTPPVDPTDSSKFAMEWPLPPDTLIVHGVSFDGVPLKPASHDELVNTGAEFSTASGFPRRYYIRKNRFIDFIPRPFESKTVQAYLVLKDPDLTLATPGTTDIPNQPRVYSKAVVSYACWQLLDGQPEEQDRANSFRANYYQQRAEAKNNLSKNIEFVTRRLRPLFY